MVVGSNPLIDKKKLTVSRDKKNDDVVYDKLSKNPTSSVGTSASPKTKKKVSKNGKARDSGTSSEEERWLDAIESGKLEEVTFFFYVKSRVQDLGLGLGLESTV